MRNDCLSITEKLRLTVPPVLSEKEGANTRRGSSGPCDTALLAVRISELFCARYGTSISGSSPARGVGASCVQQSAGGEKSGTVASTREGWRLRLEPSTTVSLFLRLGDTPPLNLDGGAIMARAPLYPAEAVYRLRRMAFALSALSELLPPSEHDVTDVLSVLSDSMLDCLDAIEPVKQGNASAEGGV